MQKRPHFIRVEGPVGQSQIVLPYLDVHIYGDFHDRIDASPCRLYHSTPIQKVFTDVAAKAKPSCPVYIFLETAPSQADDVDFDNNLLVKDSPLGDVIKHFQPCIDYGYYSKVEKVELGQKPKPCGSDSLTVYGSDMRWGDWGKGEKALGPVIVDLIVTHGTKPPKTWKTPSRQVLGDKWPQNFAVLVRLWNKVSEDVRRCLGAVWVSEMKQRYVDDVNQTCVTDLFLLLKLLEMSDRKRRCVVLGYFGDLHREKLDTWFYFLNLKSYVSVETHGATPYRSQGKKYVQCVVGPDPRVSQFFKPALAPN